MEFRGDDPGSVQFGNFINYYQFNSADERLKLLPTNVWSTAGSTDPFLALDVGCNSGVITQLLYDFLSEHTKRPVRLLGVDIDPTLIERAKDSNLHDQNVSYQCLDVMDSAQFKAIKEHLAANLKSQFDAVFCLSISMWIHLNHGDSGLKQFLSLCSKHCNLLVVEPQPWKCYQTAVKRLRKGKDTFPLFAELKWRTNVEDEIQTFIEQDLHRRKIFETEPTKWKRKICIYATLK